MNFPRKWLVLLAVFMIVSFGLVVLPSAFGQDVDYDGYCLDRWGVPAEFRNQNWYCQGRSGILVQAWVRDWEQSRDTTSTSTTNPSGSEPETNLDYDGYCQNRFGVNAEF